MLPRRYIEEWKEFAPWPEDAQVEQDLVIEKAMLELFSDPFLQERLAFRGGTALHKVFLKPQDGSQPQYLQNRENCLQSREKEHPRAE